MAQPQGGSEGAHIKDIAGDLLLCVGETVEGIILSLLAFLHLHVAAGVLRKVHVPSFNNKSTWFAAEHYFMIQGLRFW